MPNPDVDAEPGIEEVTTEPDPSFQEFVTPPEGHNPFQESMQEAAAEDIRPKGEQKTEEELAEEQRLAEEAETQEAQKAEESAETKAEETEAKQAKADETQEVAEDGISEEDIEKYIQSQEQSAGELPESLRNLQSPYQEQTQPQEQVQQQEELPAIDLGKAKEALVKAIGEEEGKTVADSLEPYMGEILNQAQGYIDAAITQGIRSYVERSSREQGYLQQAASGFYQAFPDLDSPAGKRLVAMNYNRLVSSGRKFANDGELLNHLGIQCMDQLREIGKGETTRAKTKRRGTAAETVGAQGAREVQKGSRTEKDTRTESTKELDGVLDHHQSTFANGMNFFQ